MIWFFKKKLNDLVKAVNSSLEKMYFYASWKKEYHKGLEQHEGE